MPSIVVLTWVLVIVLLGVVIWIIVKQYHSTKDLVDEEEQDEFYPELVSDAPESNQLLQNIKYPFVLNDELVPVFASHEWNQVFYQLTDQTNIVGWIAFQNSHVGAANRVYDMAFLDVLRTLKSSLFNLKKEVGLTSIQDTFIRGSEGNIWFVYEDDGIWLTLFVESNGDIRELVNIIHGLLPSHI